MTDQNAPDGTPVQTPGTAPKSTKLTRDGITIWQRYPDQPQALYYVRMRVQKKPKTIALCDTADESFKKARKIKRAIIEGRFAVLDQVKHRLPPAASLADLIAAYETGPSDASADTRAVNVHALKAIVGNIATVSELTGRLARAWFEAAQTKALLETSQEAAASLRRSANSRWSQASSMFTAKCLAHYKDKNLFHVAMLEFIEAGDAAKFTGRAVPKISYNAPSEAIIATTLASWEQIEDRNLFLAIGHELAFGLRAGETSQAVWKWWSARAGYPVLDGQATVKGGTGLLQVRALDPWFSIMRNKVEQRGWRGKDDEFIITGTDTYRTDGVFRAVSDWMRKQGWTTRKTNHALRAYAGSQIAMKFGIYEAQCWLRHSTVKVTEQHYTHFITKFKPADLETIPARWATVAREFKPVIVPHSEPQAASA